MSHRERIQPPQRPERTPAPEDIPSGDISSTPPVDTTNSPEQPAPPIVTVNPTTGLVEIKRGDSSRFVILQEPTAIAALIAFAQFPPGEPIRTADLRINLITPDMNQTAVKNVVRTALRYIDRRMPEVKTTGTNMGPNATRRMNAHVSVDDTLVLPESAVPTPTPSYTQEQVPRTFVQQTRSSNQEELQVERQSASTKKTHDYKPSLLEAKDLEHVAISIPISKAGGGRETVRAVMIPAHLRDIALEFIHTLGRSPEYIDLTQQELKILKSTFRGQGLMVIEHGDNTFQLAHRR